MIVQPSAATIKQDYTSYLSKATTLIHAPETSSSIVNMLAGPDTPQQKVADATVMIMQRIDQAGRQAGVEISDFVRCIAAHAIVQLLDEIGVTAGKLKKMDANMINLSMSIAIQNYFKGEIKAGRIDPQKLKATIQSGIARAPQKTRQQMHQSLAAIQRTAKSQSNNAASVNSTTPIAAAPPPPKGLISTAQSNG